MQDSSAIQLIEYNPDKETYSLSRIGKAVLEEQSAPFGVISIYGPYRTGKSTLLNKCLLGSQDGAKFEVGNSVAACTKGIWMHRHPVRTPTGLPVYILDIEGAFSFDATNDHDSNLFALALLLSSFFIYNSVKSIDSIAVKNLSFVTNLSKKLHSNAESSSFFPQLLWLIRDFSLNLETERGEPLSADQYLEDSLAKLDGQNSSIVTVLNETFSTRHCRTLVRPCFAEEDLVQLNQDEAGVMRAEFKDGLVELEKFVYSRVTAKTDPLREDKFLSGTQLCALITRYTESINSGTLPRLGDMWEVICKQQAGDLRLQLLAQMDPWLRDHRDLDTLHSTATGHRERLRKVFIQTVPDPTEEHQLLENFDRLVSRRKEQLLEEIDQTITNRLGSITDLEVTGASAPLSQLRAVFTRLEQSVRATYGQQGALPVLERLGPCLYSYIDRQVDDLQQSAAALLERDRDQLGLQQELQAEKLRSSQLESTHTSSEFKLAEYAVEVDRLANRLASAEQLRAELETSLEEIRQTTRDSAEQYTAVIEKLEQDLQTSREQGAVTPDGLPPPLMTLG